MLARYPHEEGWSSFAFTKTQYATHFLDAHLLVIAALDACDEVGILESASDEGGYSCAIRQARRRRLHCGAKGTVDTCPHLERGGHATGPKSRPSPRPSSSSST